VSDPTRWKDNGSEEAQLLVAELTKVEPSAALRERVWAGIALTLPPASGGGSSSGGPGPSGPSAAGASGPAGVSLAKVLAAGAVGVGAGALSLRLLALPLTPLPVTTEASTIASTGPPISASTPTPESLLPPPTPPPNHGEGAASRSQALSTSRQPRGARSAPEVASLPAPSTRAPAAPSREPIDRLREEAEGVRTARQFLREKRPAQAAAELDRLATLFPAGPLEEEREVLSIEALVGSNQVEAARRRGERFLFERPQSVHAARVRALSGLEAKRGSSE